MSNAATNLVNATNACLIISNVQSNNAGYYSVAVANAFDTVLSSTNSLTVTPVCVAIELYAGLTLTEGNPGQHYSIQFVSNIQDTNWMTLTTVTQTVSGVFWLDPEPATRQRRFYQAISAP